MDIKRIIFELENLLSFEKDAREVFGERQIESLSVAINILKKQMWIPCSEQMPEERKLSDTEKISSTVMVMICDSAGNKIVTTGHTINGKWKTDEWFGRLSVVSWKPFPEPY